MKKLLLLALVLLVLPSVYANWNDVMNDSNNRNTLVNVTTAQGEILLHPYPKFSESLLSKTGVADPPSRVANKSLTDYQFLANENKTVEFWFYYNHSEVNPTTGDVIFKLNQSNGGTQVQLKWDSSFSSKVGFGNLTFKTVVFAGSGSTVEDVISNRIFNDSAWHHFAMIWYNTSANGTNWKNLRVFADGVSIHRTAFANGSDISLQWIDFGFGGDNGAPDAVGIDEVRISNITRYLDNFTVPTEPFTLDVNTISLWHFDDPDIPDNEIAQCDAPKFYQGLAANITFWDEGNRTRFDGITKFEASFISMSLNDTSLKQNLTLSVDNPNAIGICITPKDHVFEVNSTIKYAKTGWNFRHYYHNSDNFTDTIQNTTLYLLQSDEATAITILVTDSLDTALDDIITEVQKFYIGQNKFITIGMMKSGEDGKDIIYLQQNEIDYRFLLYQEGALVKTTTGQKLTASTYTIKIIPSSLTDLIANIKGFQTNLTFLNNTKTWKFGYYDPSAKMAGACVVVSMSNTTNSYIKPANCTYGNFRGHVTGSFINSTVARYSGYGYIIMNGSTLVFAEITADRTVGIAYHVNTWGKYGLFLLMCLLIALIFVVSYNPILMIVMAMATLFSAWWMDIFSISTLAFVSLMVGLGVLIKELRT